MNLKAAIFDMDGTLLDSNWVWDRVDKEFQKHFSLQVADDYYDNVVHMTPTQMANYTIEEYHLPFTAEELKAHWLSIAEQLYTKEVKLKEGAFEWLHYLKEEGVKLGLATSCFRSLCEQALKANGVLDLFDCICIAEEFGKSKEDASLYLYCAKQLGVAPKDCIVFEDICKPLLSVKKNQMGYVGVMDSRQSEATRNELQKSADLYIENFCSLKGCSYFL